MQIYTCPYCGGILLVEIERNNEKIISIISIEIRDNKLHCGKCGKELDEEITKALSNYIRIE